VTEAKPIGSAVGLTLSPNSSDATRRFLPHNFDLLYTITVGPTLKVSLEVRNASSSPFTFEEALHTYLSVGDVREVTIEGLDGRTFIDKTASGSRNRQSGPIRIEREADRVYLDTTDEVRVSDPRRGRELRVAKAGSNTTVVWNPWIDKAKAMVDFGDEEWPSMLCIETANVADNAVTLGPGETQVMSAVISSANHP
jgi:glucose-6-phosphate 1-epimerase